MGALPNVAKVVRFDFRQSYGPNSRILDRLFLRYSGALSSTDLATVLTTIRNAWNTNMAPVLLTSHTLLSVTGTDLSSNTSPQAVNSTASTGTAVSTALPENAAMVIKFKINKRYRGGHPRWYLLGLGTGSLVSQNQWAGGAITSILTAWQAFIAACVLAPPAAVGTLTHTSVNYFAGFTVVTNPVTHRARNVPIALGTPLTNDVVSYAVNPLVASQRRRNQQSV